MTTTLTRLIPFLVLCVRQAIALGLGGVIIGCLVIILGVAAAALVGKKLSGLKPRELPPQEGEEQTSKDPKATSWLDGLPAQLFDYADILNTNPIVSVYVFGSWPASPTNADGSEPIVWERVGMAATRIERSTNLKTWTSVCAFQPGSAETYRDAEVTIEWKADNSGVEITPSPGAWQQPSIFWRAVPEDP